ncbi:MAG: hypothetical protein ACMUIE_08130 [Thermoplasmatota archaeon]
MGEPVRGIIVDEETDDDFDVDTSEYGQVYHGLVRRRKRAGKVLIWTGAVQMIFIFFIAFLFFREAYYINQEIEEYEPESILEELFAELIVALMVLAWASNILLGMIVVAFGTAFLTLFFLAIAMIKGKPLRGIRNGTIGMLIFTFVLAILSAIVAYLFLRVDEVYMTNVFVIETLLLAGTISVFFFVLNEIRETASTFEPDPPYPGAELFLRSIDVEPRWKSGEPYDAGEVRRMREYYFINYPRLGKGIFRSSMILLIIQMIALIVAVPIFPHLIGEWKGAPFEPVDLVDFTHYGPVEISLFVFLISTAISIPGLIFLISRTRKMTLMNMKVKANTVRKWYAVIIILVLIFGCIPVYLLIYPLLWIGAVVMTIFLLTMLMSVIPLVKTLRGVMVTEIILTGESNRFHPVVEGI